MLTAALIVGSPASLAIGIIIIAALVAIVFIAVKAMGVPVPAWVVQILFVVLIAIVAIFAIKFLLTVV